MTKQKRTAIILATFLAFIWGISFLSIKVAISVIPPMTLGFSRFVIATLVLLLSFAIMRKPIKLARKDLPRMALTGFIGITLYFLGENNGVAILSASEASIIIGTIPVISMVTERVFLKTNMSRGQYAGAFLSTAGVACIVLESMRISPSPLGYVFMAIAAVSWVVYAFATRPLTRTYDSFEITLWQTIFGALGFAPFMLSERMDFAALTPIVVANVLYLGIFCSALGYILYVISLRILGPGVSSVFINLIPVVSVAASYVILDERLSFIQILGALITLCGVYLAGLAEKRTQ